ncbi:bifunctional diaminohydroxyphosphoribosylaminopyrimidine deaminase/5-amino-6-(5-phosphoribosylamino)uracil reductase RibD [Aurantimicrobium minutum]|uniref:bifunctional diaminohydroxyphosphoribosylaminopyrimidine deaminase/5-amino-6-(5-phosphoribosylamino)uracil reductase RibD n=1 Tax=Aurantimicrobium minutum TaxID=708131 RepID=UPI002474D822|nr:bifunctional diaminohydroxyphosphoribosylaminopyrimidine deaminase/5-amino-6-(5-phosphoribosylamino)uracil reductase RibD [Aurantimicrobium minutum]MDH6254544.1 diaminohydroxyphosphoribosylaminopyrimidine deaminase/5-amino-6-(5-phosphoribosylamino)uracil reductase [Aurantimicrobium minutum]
MSHTTPSKAYEASMRRAIALAGNGPSNGVNPQVGCVVLNSAGTIIAEGWHRGAGTAHAEVDALSQLTPEQAQGSTFVVTLEPCNHTGRTGPCAQALIEAGVGTVVYAATDPGHASSGGAQRLRDAGIEVIGGVLEDNVEELLEEWMLAARLHRPHVTVKWAASLDGRAAAHDGTSQWISGPESRARVHEQRAAADAIVVGTGTVLADNPSLTARTPEGGLHDHQPVPVIIGKRNVPGDALVHEHPLEPLIIGHNDLHAALSEMFDNGIRSVFVEGGPTLASAFIAAGLADRLYIYLAPVLLGGDKVALGDLGVGTLADRIDLNISSVERLGEDIFITATPNRKDV